MTINLDSENIINDIINNSEELQNYAKDNTENVVTDDELQEKNETINKETNKNLDVEEKEFYEEDFEDEETQCYEDEIPYCNEEDLLDEIDDDFEYQIKSRGRDYYNNGNIVLCCKLKDKNKYYAKVKGNKEKPYIVTIEITEDNIDFDCTCPYEFPCKHEYAVLMAISNQEYFIEDLKPEIKEKKCDLKSVLRKIPAEEIKNYLLSPKGADYVCFEMNTFENYFKKYYPHQEYDYYYNNLYNALSLEDEYEKMTDSYLNVIKQYIATNEFEESIKIIISIINAYNDTNKLNFNDYIINQFPLIGMYLRIINRKCNEKVKQDLLSFTLELEENNYYNNLYLEDIILMLKN